MSSLAVSAGWRPSRHGVWLSRCWARSRPAETRRSNVPRHVPFPCSSRPSRTIWRPTPHRSADTDTKYRGDFGSHLGDWQLRPLDAITRQDVEALFNRLTGDLGWSAANRAISLLRAIYRRPCVDFEGLRNPVDSWLAGGGRYHRPKRRKISAPAEVLPCWKKGIEAAVGMASARDALWFGLYTGMRIDEVLALRWERVDMAGLVFPGRGDQDGRASGTARHPATGGHP